MINLSRACRQGVAMTDRNHGAKVVASVIGLTVAVPLVLLGKDAAASRWCHWISHAMDRARPRVKRALFVFTFCLMSGLLDDPLVYWITG